MDPQSDALSSTIDQDFNLSGKDDWLAHMYVNEPRLNDVELFPLFGQTAAPDEMALSPSTIKSAYEADAGSLWVVERLKSSISFLSDPTFCNPSRCEPKRVKAAPWSSSSSPGGVYFTVPSAVATPRKGSAPSYVCFLTTGIVAYCNLSSEATRVFTRYGSRTDEKVVDHRIGIYPFEYEYQRAITFFGHVAGKKTLRYTFSSGVLHFTTRQEGGVDVSANFGASPQKSVFHKKNTTSSKSTNLNPIVDNIKEGRFPASLSYADKGQSSIYIRVVAVSSEIGFGCTLAVPVFDARSPTALGGKFDLSAIHKLPQYKGDVEANSLVMVGYTANTYLTGPRSSTPNVDMLSTNVQFVVIHADAPGHC
ncbi:hypothetical protein NMY22_g11889 [Coprinellus aureogranulatus]|nr:hypothetical protein NMY22_g11889 [Coprinellus aureogranulatus]